MRRRSARGDFAVARCSAKLVPWGLLPFWKQYKKQVHGVAVDVLAAAATRRSPLQLERRRQWFRWPMCDPPSGRGRAKHSVFIPSHRDCGVTASRYFHDAWLEERSPICLLCTRTPAQPAVFETRKGAKCCQPDDRYDGHPPASLHVSMACAPLCCLLAVYDAVVTARLMLIVSRYRAVVLHAVFFGRRVGKLSRWSQTALPIQRYRGESLNDTRFRALPSNLRSRRFGAPTSMSLKPRYAARETARCSLVLIIGVFGRCVTGV